MYAMLDDVGFSEIVIVDDANRLNVLAGMA
jgi:hypothetical protein